MGVLHVLAKDGQRELIAGGVEWRIRRVDSSDLMFVQGGMLAMLQASAGEEAPTKELISSLSLDEMAQAASMQDAMVCAAVTHARELGGEWEAIRLVPNREKADPDQGSLWVADIHYATRQEIFGEAMALTTEDGEAVERLQSFRERA